MANLTNGGPAQGAGAARVFIGVGLVVLGTTLAIALVLSAVGLGQRRERTAEAAGVLPPGRGRPIVWQGAYGWRQPFRVETSSRIARQGVNRYVVGRAYNNSGRDSTGAKVEFTLYDSAGRQLGSTVATTTGWKAGACWEFRAPVWDEEAVAYSRPEITAR